MFVVYRFARAVCLGLILLATPVVAQNTLSPLITAETLARLVDEGAPQIIDIRNKRALRPLYSYSAGHIPGAVNVPLKEWRAIWADPVALPSARDLTMLVRTSGLVKSRPVVIVHSSAAKGNFGSAAWVYWVLKSGGFTDLAILDGGIRAWKTAGQPLTRLGTPIRRSREVALLDTTWLATHEDVDAVIAGTSTAQLLDARPIHQIAGSASLPNSRWLDSGELMNGPDGQAGDQLAIFERLKFADVMWDSQDTITYCNNGLLAAVDWFMASEVAGIPNVRLYGHSLKARKAARPAG